MILFFFFFLSHDRMLSSHLTFLWGSWFIDDQDCYPSINNSTTFISVSRDLKNCYLVDWSKMEGTRGLLTTDDDNNNNNPPLLTDDISISSSEPRSKRVKIEDGEGSFQTILHSTQLPQYEESEEDSKLRFQMELEFIQCLANPRYLNCKLVSTIFRC